MSDIVNEIGVIRDMRQKRTTEMKCKTCIKTGLAVLVIGAITLTGCGLSVPELSEEESAQVSEYASGLLLKYDKNYSNRLVEEEEVPVAQPVEEVIEEKKEDTGVPEGTEVQDNTGGQADAAAKNVESDVQAYLGIEGYQIQYTGYEVKERYPDQGDAELYMAMGATPDHKLLVLKFDATNLGDSDSELDTLSQNVRYKIAVNGGEDTYTLTTMLIDDLSTYKGMIPAGGTQQLVLVSQIPSSMEGQIETITLKMKGKGQDAIQKLK